MQIKRMNICDLQGSCCTMGYFILGFCLGQWQMILKPVLTYLFNFVVRVKYYDEWDDEV